MTREEYNKGMAKKRRHQEDAELVGKVMRARQEERIEYDSEREQELFAKLRQFLPGVL